MAQTKGKINTLTIPVWFIVLVCWLLSFRVYAKLTQDAAPRDKGVAWVTPTQLDEMAKKPGGLNKELILYEFTADWCPPCKKRERTVFRAPAVISEINSNFIPVRVDLTNAALCNIPATKNLTQLFSVNSIPRCVITLKSGEKVDDDRYLFGDKFASFITRSRDSANTVRAKLALAKGRNDEALALLTADLVKGNVMIDRDSCTEYLMCHHLLLVTKHQAEVEPMMQKALAKTSDYYRQTSDKDALSWLRELNKYLRDEINDEQLLKSITYGGDRSIYYLAIGLKQLRLGDKVKALKALHQAAVLSAKHYNSDGLSEPLVHELEK
ncbi:MAG: thioredoxin family protein [Candidatus Obscuribacterales bacterium]